MNTVWPWSTSHWMKEVHRRPLLVIPPWMNKYYVLDLRPGNSFIQWLVDQGHTVFIISWVNPGKRLARKSFEDYMHEGILAAIDAVQEATGEGEVNAMGYCLGGILLAGTMAYLTAKGEQGRVKSATYLTTMVDFSDVGDITLFIDEEGLAELEGRIHDVGYQICVAVTTQELGSYLKAQRTRNQRAHRDA